MGDKCKYLLTDSLPGCIFYTPVRPLKQPVAKGRIVSRRLAQTPGLWGLRFPEGTGFGRGLIPAVHFQDRRILPEIETPTRPRPAARFSHETALNPIIAQVVQLFPPVRHNPLTRPPTSATLSRKGARAGSRRARALHCHTVISFFLGKGF